MTYVIESEIEEQGMDKIDRSGYECSEKVNKAFCPAISGRIHGLFDADLYAWVLGRERETHLRFGRRGLGLLGFLCEEHNGTDSGQAVRVYQDILEPHVAVIVGARGGGKSYTLGVNIENVAQSGHRIGSIVIDRCGVFGCLANANNDKLEEERLSGDAVVSHGLKNVKVFAVGPKVPSGEIPFRIRTSQMTADDWCHFWSIPPTCPRHDLIRELIAQTSRGYGDEQGTGYKDVKAYDLGDLIRCVKGSRKINGPDGFARSTIRSVTQKLLSARSLGIFSRQGTRIKELSVPGQVSVLNLSDPSIDEACASKIVGLIARMVLAARTASVMDQKEVIPVTWLFVDEAHLFVGAEAESGSAEDLIQYAKLGRKPGCGLVLATQQPSAMNRAVLSQADIVVAHRLVFAADIASFRRITPAALPEEICISDTLIRSLPRGTAIVADKMTQNRAMVVRIRPRLSAHGGQSAMPLPLDAPASTRGQLARQKSDNTRSPAERAEGSEEKKVLIASKADPGFICERDRHTGYTAEDIPSGQESRDGVDQRICSETNDVEYNSEERVVKDPAAIVESAGWKATRNTVGMIVAFVLGWLCVNGVFYFGNRQPGTLSAVKSVNSRSQHEGISAVSDATKEETVNTGGSSGGDSEASSCGAYDESGGKSGSAPVKVDQAASESASDMNTAEHNIPANKGTKPRNRARDVFKKNIASLKILHQ